MIRTMNGAAIIIATQNARIMNTQKNPRKSSIRSLRTHHAQSVPILLRSQHMGIIHIAVIYRRIHTRDTIPELVLCLACLKFIGIRGLPSTIIRQTSNSICISIEDAIARSSNRENNPFTARHYEIAVKFYTPRNVVPVWLNLNVMLHLWEIEVRKIICSIYVKPFVFILPFDFHSIEENRPSRFQAGSEIISLISCLDRFDKIFTSHNFVTNNSHYYKPCSNISLISSRSVSTNGLFSQ